MTKRRISIFVPCASALAIAIALAAESPPEPAPELAPEPAPKPLRVTYIGNEGFMIESGEVKILIDALYRKGVPGYVVIPEERRRLLETAQPPFDGVTLILASHSHADHFDPGAVVEYLKASPKTVFLSTPQAIEHMKAVPGFETVQGRTRAVLPEEGKRFRTERPGLVLQVLNLHHGGGQKVENLGFILVAGDVSILHVGDTAESFRGFEVNRIAEEGIDLAFLPYWYLTEGNKESLSGTIAPRHKIVAMHLPPPSDPGGLLKAQGGFDKLAEDIERIYPTAVVFRNEMETRELP